MALKSMTVFAAVLASAAAAPSSSALPPVCTNLPAGFCSGVMVPDVPYTVPAMYGCADKCKDMTIWCQADAKGKAYEYLYCCGNKCSGMPKERKCMVNGCEYTVGQAYTVKLGHKKVTLWCTSETEYVTCQGKQCGSCPELTPPAPGVCPAPKPPVYPVPPKPQPPRPTPPVVVPPVIAPQDYECVACIQNGFLWNEGKAQCQFDGICPMDLMSDCHKDLGRCPVRI